MANGMYNSGLNAVMVGTIDLDGTSDMRGIMLKSAYTYDPDHDDVADFSAGEMAQGAACRTTLGGETTIIDDTANTCAFDCNDPSHTSLVAGDTPSQWCVYLYNATDSAAQALCRCALSGTPASPNGGNYGLTIPAAGVFTIAS